MSPNIKTLGMGISERFFKSQTLKTWEDGRTDGRTDRYFIRLHNVSTLLCKSNEYSSTFPKTYKLNPFTCRREQGKWKASQTWQYIVLSKNWLCSFKVYQLPQYCDNNIVSNTCLRWTYTRQNQLNRWPLNFVTNSFEKQHWSQLSGFKSVQRFSQSN